MANFIRLTDAGYDKATVYINPDNIDYMFPVNNDNDRFEYTAIYFSNGNNYDVKETPDQIIGACNRAKVLF